MDYKITPEGLEIAVKVTPKAKQNKIIGFAPQGLKIQVTAAPEKGLANEAVIALLAKACGTAKKNVHVIAGDTSQTKKILICGLGSELLESLKTLTA